MEELDQAFEQLGVLYPYYKTVTEAVTQSIASITKPKVVLSQDAILAQMASRQHLGTRKKGPYRNVLRFAHMLVSITTLRHTN